MALANLLLPLPPVISSAHCVVASAKVMGPGPHPVTCRSGNYWELEADHRLKITVSASPLLLRNFYTKLRKTEPTDNKTIAI